MTPLSDLRRTRTFKQSDMARLVGVDQATWSRYESGEVLPPFAKRIKIAALLGTLERELWPEVAV